MVSHSSEQHAAQLAGVVTGASRSATVVSVSSDTTTWPKVALLVHEKHYGGGTRQTFYLLKALCELGYPAMLVSNARQSWLGEQISAAAIPVEAYYSGRIQRELNPWQDLLAMIFLVRTFRHAKPQVVLCSGVKLMGMGILAAWLTGVPHRWTIVRGQGAAPGSRSMPFVLALEKLVAWLGGRYITVSEYDRQWMLQHGVTQASRIKTVHNGTVIPEAPVGPQKGGVLWQQYGLPSDAFVIGMVGRFTAQKRYDQFIELMAQLCAQHPNAYGFLIGDGDDRDRLQGLIASTGFSDRIHIAGYHQDMASVYQGLHASVLLTHYEGCPNALLESAAWGIPAVADRVCGNPEVIQHGINGVIVEPGDTQAAAQALSHWIQHPEQAYQLGLAGHALAKQQFDQGQQVRQVIRTLTDEWRAKSNAPTAPQEGTT
jgi:glycosyltransferase involved in cell wall biosynthesis